MCNRERLIEDDMPDAFATMANPANSKLESSAGNEDVEMTGVTGLNDGDSSKQAAGQTTTVTNNYRIYTVRADYASRYPRIDQFEQHLERTSLWCVVEEVFAAPANKIYKRLGDHKGFVPTGMDRALLLDDLADCYAWLQDLGYNSNTGLVRLLPVPVPYFPRKYHIDTASAANAPPSTSGRQAQAGQQTVASGQAQVAPRNTGSAPAQFIFHNPTTVAQPQGPPPPVAGSQDRGRNNALLFALGTPKLIDIRLLGTVELSVEEILTFFPQHYVWDHFLVRLRATGWCDTGPARLILYARGLDITSNTDAGTKLLADRVNNARGVLAKQWGKFTKKSAVVKANPEFSAQSWSLSSNQVKQAGELHSVGPD